MKWVKVKYQDIIRLYVAVNNHSRMQINKSFQDLQLVSENRRNFSPFCILKPFDFLPINVFHLDVNRLLESKKLHRYIPSQAGVVSKLCSWTALPRDILPPNSCWYKRPMWDVDCLSLSVVQQSKLLSWLVVRWPFSWLQLLCYSCYLLPRRLHQKLCLLIRIQWKLLLTPVQLILWLDKVLLGPLLTPSHLKIFVNSK